MIILKRYYVIENNPERTQGYRVDRCEQPALDVFKHWAFHHVLEKVLTPLSPLINRYLEARYVPEDEDNWYFSFDVRVDIKCYTLGQKNLHVLDSLKVNETTYNELDKSMVD